MKMSTEQAEAFVALIDVKIEAAKPDPNFMSGFEVNSAEKLFYALFVTQPGGDEEVADKEAYLDSTEE